MSLWKNQTMVFVADIETGWCVCVRQYKRKVEQKVEAGKKESIRNDDTVTDWLPFT